jgi:hypothetical protein
MDPPGTLIAAALFATEAIKAIKPEFCGVHRQRTAEKCDRRVGSWSYRWAYGRVALGRRSHLTCDQSDQSDGMRFSGFRAPAHPNTVNSSVGGLPSCRGPAGGLHLERGDDADSPQVVEYLLDLFGVAMALEHVAADLGCAQPVRAGLPQRDEHLLRVGVAEAVTEHVPC